MKEITKALIKVQNEIGIVPFDKINPHFKTKYASLGAIMAAVKPVLSKHDIVLRQHVDGTNVITTLTHISGESISDGGVPLVLARQDMQTLGGAITYAKRYGLSAMLAIVTDEDDDGNTASVPKAGEVKEPNHAQQQGFVPKLGLPSKTANHDKPALGDCTHRWLKSKYKDDEEWCTKCKAKRPIQRGGQDDIPF